MSRDPAPNPARALLAISPDGNLVAEVADGACQVWLRPTGRTVASPATGAEPTALAFSEDSAVPVLALGDAAGGVHTWSPGDGLVHQHTGHSARVTALAFGGGGLLLSGDADGSVTVWNTRTRLAEHRIDLDLREPFGTQVSALAVRADGRFAAVTAGGRLFLGPDRTPTAVHQAAEVPAKAVSVSFAARADVLLTVGGGTAQLRDPADGRDRALLAGHPQLVLAGAVAPDGARAVTGGLDRLVWVWETATAKVLHALDDLNGWVLALRFVADGAQLVAGDGDGEVCLWDVRTGALLARSHRLGSRAAPRHLATPPREGWEQEAARHAWSRIACCCPRGARHVPDDFARLVAARTPEEASGRGLANDVESRGFLSEAALPLASLLLLALEREPLSAPARFQVLDLLMACVEGEADFSASASGHPDIDEECCDAVRRGIPLFYRELMAESTPGGSERAFYILRALGEDTEHLENVRKRSGS